MNPLNAHVRLPAQSKQTASPAVGLLLCWKMEGFDYGDMEAVSFLSKPPGARQDKMPKKFSQHQQSQGFAYTDGTHIYQLHTR